MGFLTTFLPRDDRYAALLLYGMVFATCFNGYDAGIMSVILADKQFQSYYNVDATRSGVIATIPWASTGLAQLIVAGPLASLVGRLWALRLSMLVMMIGVTVQVVPNTYAVLVVGRLITGLGFGCIYVAANLYVAECSPTKLRGSFVGTVSQFGYQLGTLIAFWAGYGMSFVKSPFNIAWRVSNVLQIPIGLFFITISFFYIESPRWLLEKYPDSPELVLQTLAKLRSGSTDSEHVQAEYRELVLSREYRRTHEIPGYIGIIKSPALRKRLIYGFYAAALQQVGGIAAVTMYAVLIYESLGWNNGSQALAINGIQSVLQLFIVLVNTFTVDRFGRKQLLIAGFSIQAMALLILAALTTSFPDNGNRAAAIVEVAMLFIVGLTYCWSNGPIAPIVATEIFPQHVRDKAFAMSMLGQTGCLLAITQPWPSLYERVNVKSYWLLFGLNMLALISVVLILPETKGISLEHMEKVFGEKDFVEEGEKEISQRKGVELEKGNDMHVETVQVV